MREAGTSIKGDLEIEQRPQKKNDTTHLDYAANS